ncbi:Branched-chain amino acid ABC transporter, amino acid-binding protein [Minicystis rosea]|nr:Branched-chain amino acid ABC transporter, amino acid-binding protein [Minicystis rosea]
MQPRRGAAGAAGSVQPIAHGADAPLLIGSIFSLESAREIKLTQAVRLAVQEINQAGLDGGQKLGVVFCDNGGAGNMTSGAEREKLNQHAVDYLAGTLGVPYLVGPLTSDDAIALVNQMLKKQYPSVIISPGATSPGLTQNSDRLDPKDPYGLFWRTCPSDEIQGKVLAKSVISEDKTILKVTVIYVDDAYGQGLSQVFQKEWPGDVTDVIRVPYEAAALDDATALAKLVDDADAANGDAVLVVAHQKGTEDSAARKILDAMEGKTIATKPFFFTDGTKSKASLFKAPIPMHTQTILLAAKGTAPANPSGQNYNIFDTNLFARFGIHASDESFLAQSYDAAYIGAFGVVYATQGKKAFTGLDVAEGLTKLSAGTLVDLNGVNAWTTGKGLIAQEGQIDVEGASGHLQFDPATGEAPGPIEVWGVDATLTDFTQIKIVPP